MNGHDFPSHENKNSEKTTAEDKKKDVSALHQQELN
jgi:hypothetical protein